MITKKLRIKKMFRGNIVEKGLIAGGGGIEWNSLASLGIGHHFLSYFYLFLSIVVFSKLLIISNTFFVYIYLTTHIYHLKLIPIENSNYKSIFI